MTGTDTKSTKKPSRPRVDIGPKSYGIKKHGRRLCIRFFIYQYKSFGRSKGKSFARNIWFVGDMETGGRAARTSRMGYAREEAVAVAREYRDKYGAYTKSPF
jgi:hypothetical protein